MHHQFTHVQSTTLKRDRLSHCSCIERTVPLKIKKNRQILCRTENFKNIFKNKVLMNFSGLVYWNINKRHVLVKLDVWSF